MKTWNEAELQRYIDDEIEESTNLDYKAAGALARDKKDEITKDVSAMANADGGILIYGLKEHPSKRHVVDRFDPIDRTKFSKEWLDQMIHFIRPIINQVIIHPVSLSSGPNDVAYVVEIPKGHTAHQATSLRYFRRHNFESVPMEDYVIREVMNRATVPDASVEFKHLRKSMNSNVHTYLLQVSVKNLGTQVINHFQLEFSFPRIIGCMHNLIHKKDNIDLRSTKTHDHLIIYRSKIVLFPNEEREIGQEIVWDYEIDKEKYEKLRSLEMRGFEPSVEWILYADDMTPKQGSVPFGNLNDY